MSENEVKIQSGGGSQSGFVSEYRHNLDGKRRLTVPSFWRDLIGDEPDDDKQVFVFPGLSEPCLRIFAPEEANRRLAKVRQAAGSDREGRKLARTLTAKSELVSWDSQGRIRIKDSLLEYAGLKTEVFLVGTWEGFELWTLANWKKHNKDDDDADLDQLADHMEF